jgi:hypothetical protein
VLFELDLDEGLPDTLVSTSSTLRSGMDEAVERALENDRTIDIPHK